MVGAETGEERAVSAVSLPVRCAWAPANDVDGENIEGKRVGAAVVEPGMTAINTRITSHQPLTPGMIVVYQLR